MSPVREGGALFSAPRRRAVPRQQHFVVLDGARGRQAFQHMAQPGLGLLAVGLGGLDQAGLQL